MSNQNRFAVLAELGGGMPKPRKPKKDALFDGAYSGSQLGQMRKMMRELYPDHPHTERAPRELEGRALKKLGKQLGDESYINRGRKLQYGHLSPEELLVQHPSAFLRQHTIRAGFLQFSTDPLRAKGSTSGFNQGSTPSKKFRLMEDTSGGSSFDYFKVEDPRILDSSTGLVSTRKRDFNLVPSARSSRDGQAIFEEVTHQQPHVGPEIDGAFLPMMQSRFPQLTSAPSHKNVVSYKRGKLSTDTLDNPSHPIFTTELTGCSIVRHNNALSHIRPDSTSDGTTLQGSFSPKQSYGRMDYADAANAFVMMRKKPDGRVKLHYQTHHFDGPSVSGSRYLSPR